MQKSASSPTSNRRHFSETSIHAIRERTKSTGHARSTTGLSDVSSGYVSSKHSKQLLKLPHVDSNQALQLSFVIDGEQENAKNETDLCSVFTWTQLLAPIYSIWLILIGLALAASQAFRGEFHNSLFEMWFMTYLYLGGSIYLIIMLVFLHVAKKKAKTKQDNVNQLAADNPAFTDVTGDEALKGQTTSALPKDTLLLRVRHADSLSQPNSDTISMRSVDIRSNRSNTLNTYQRKGNKEYPSITDENIDKDKPEQVVFSVCPPSECVDGDGCGDDFSDASSVFDFSDDNSEFEEHILLQKTSSQGHEGSSFYLRLGLLVFAIGNMIFSALELQALLTLEGSCKKTFVEVHPVVWHLLFVVTQTFFLFKHNSIHMDSSCKIMRSFSRFGIQHLLATNLITWINVLCQELWEAYEHSKVEEEEHLMSSENINSTSCSTTGAPFLSAATPYLFPFVLEYSLIAVSICAGYYYSLNIRIQKDLVQSLKKAFAAKQEHHEVSKHEVMFHKAHTGMFLGIVELTGVLVAIILFFVYYASEEVYIEHYIDKGTDAAVNTVQFIATCIALYKLSSLKFTYVRDNSIDALLLVISVAGLIGCEFLYLDSTTFYINNPEEYRDTVGENGHELDRTLANLNLFKSCTTMVQALLQTCFILDAMQRSAKNKEHKENKPGRGVVTFLVITNISQWLMGSLLTKMHGHVGNYPLHYYGKTSWTMMQTFATPLALFYRFHASVCLADIWIGAYETAEEPDFKVL